MPDWKPHIRSRLASLHLSASRENEIVEELSQHLEDRWRELVGGGTPADEATKLALAGFQEEDLLARHLTPLRQAHALDPITPGASTGNLLGDLWQDLRYAARTLRKQPTFALAAILTLALGIGANTAIFTVVNATLLQRLPVPNRDRLVYLQREKNSGVFPYPMYTALRDGTQTFDGVAAWSGFVASLNAGDGADRTPGYLVTGNFFDLLGLTADRGRLLSPADDVTAGGHPVVVISRELWQTRFAGRPDIIGHEIRLNGNVFTIVGVTPAGFPGPRVGTVRHVYVPMMMQPIVRPPSDRLQSTASWLFLLGRLGPDRTTMQARAEIETLGTAHARAVNPSTSPERIPVVPIDEDNPEARQRTRAAAFLLVGVVAAVLLIACANIASLLLAKATARRRELAVRLAIGASRARLVRQLLTETVLLSLVGGVVALGMAWAIVQAFQASPPPAGALPVAVDLAIDRSVLLFSIVLSLITGLVLGAAPALKASRPSLVPALKNASSEGNDGGRRYDLQKLLVVGEVALAVLLLIPAGLFVRSLQAAHAIDPGFDGEKLVSAPLDINLLRYTNEQGREFYRTIVERAERLPGVESAAIARLAIMTGDGRIMGVLVEGRPEYPDDFVFSQGAGVVTSDPTRINANVVGPGFFRTLGIPLVSGRDFDARDVEGQPPVAIINETAVRMHFKHSTGGLRPLGGGHALGARVSFNGRQGPWREIVGVVGDSTYGELGEAALPVAYLPVGQNHESGMTLYVRTSVPPASLIASLRREIQELEPNLPVAGIETMTKTIGTSLYAARMGAWLLAGFGVLALLLAAIGIYGVLSFSIARRTREMGIRLALGAAARQVFLLVVRDGMTLVGVGAVVGLVGGRAAAQWLAGFLYGVPTSDPVTFAGTATILIVVALVACIVPARRAMRVNPITALRSE
jgi:macrolide transport system ATP-binding/permease protein